MKDNKEQKQETIIYVVDPEQALDNLEIIMQWLEQFYTQEERT